MCGKGPGGERGKQGPCRDVAVLGCAHRAQHIPVTSLPGPGPCQEGVEAVRCPRGHGGSRERFLRAPPPSAITPRRLHPMLSYQFPWAPANEAAIAIKGQVINKAKPPQAQQLTEPPLATPCHRPAGVPGCTCAPAPLLSVLQRRSTRAVRRSARYFMCLQENTKWSLQRLGTFKCKLCYFCLEKCH